jgi:hypothetical protein
VGGTVAQTIYVRVSICKNDKTKGEKKEKKKINKIKFKAKKRIFKIYYHQISSMQHNIVAMLSIRC